MDALLKSTAQDAKASERDSFFLAAPQISTPKGGGAIRGLGEKFATNPVTGTGSLTIPVPVTPGRAGFAPQLALAYDSGAGNSAFGLGWQLGLPHISRKTEKGLPRYWDHAESDRFILSGHEDLVRQCESDANGHWKKTGGVSGRIDGAAPPSHAWLHEAGKQTRRRILFSRGCGTRTHDVRLVSQ